LTYNSNNNLYPLRISELRPSSAASGQVAPPPRTKSPTKANSGGGGASSKTMTTTQSSSSGGGNKHSSQPPVFVRQLADNALKVGTRARLLIEIEAPSSDTSSTEAIKVGSEMYIDFDLEKYIIIQDYVLYMIVCTNR
jgi:hypothetical protein